MRTTPLPPPALTPPPTRRHHPPLYEEVAVGRRVKRIPATKSLRVWADVADGVKAVWSPSERLQRVSDAIAAALDAEVKRRSEMRDNHRFGQHKAQED